MQNETHQIAFCWPLSTQNFDKKLNKGHPTHLPPHGTISVAPKFKLFSNLNLALKKLGQFFEDVGWPLLKTKLKFTFNLQIVTTLPPDMYFQITIMSHFKRVAGQQALQILPSPIVPTLQPPIIRQYLKHSYRIWHDNQIKIHFCNTKVSSKAKASYSQQIFQKRTFPTYNDENFIPKGLFW